MKRASQIQFSTKTRVNPNCCPGNTVHASSIRQLKNNHFRIKNAILAIIAILVSFATNAQTEAFNNVALQPTHGRQVLRFTVPHEQNVRHYRIEASNDGTNYEVIATVPAKGNAVFNTDYSYDVTAYTYAYYRIGKVEMNGRMPYSVAVNKTEHPKEQQSQPTRSITSENIIVKQ